MNRLQCPLCKKQLSRDEYETALGIYEEIEAERTRLTLEAKRAKEKGIEEGRAEEKKRVQRELAEEREALSRQARQLDKREAQFQKEKRELAEKARASLAKGIEQGIENERKRAERLMAGQSATITKLEERIRQLEKGSTPQTEGLEFEGTLVERLRDEWPADDVTHHGKNGDVVHVVREAGEIAGTIVYECKRTSQIQRAHVEQAGAAKRGREADFAVLVTTGKRKGFGGVDEEDGVVIVGPLGVMPVVALLRQYLVRLHHARLSDAERSKAAESLVRYVTGPQFRNPLQDSITRARELQKSLQLEVKQHMKNWNERWESYQSLEWDATQIDSNIQLVLQGGKPRAAVQPKIAALQLGAKE
jgi:hypothetical protein